MSKRVVWVNPEMSEKVIKFLEEQGWQVKKIEVAKIKSLGEDDNK